MFGCDREITVRVFDRLSDAKWMLFLIGTRVVCSREDEKGWSGREYLMEE